MEDDEGQLRDDDIVELLKNASVDVELEAIVPVVGVGEVVDRRLHRLPLVFKLDFLGAFPVVDGEGAVGLLIDHIDGAGEFDVVLEDEPLGAKGNESPGLSPPPFEGLEVVPLRPRRRHVVVTRQIPHRFGVVVVFDVQVHLGSGAACGRARIRPLRLDLVRRHSKVG